MSDRDKREELDRDEQWRDEPPGGGMGVPPGGGTVPPNGDEDQDEAGVGIPPDGEGDL